ncbi:unnamed protein product [Eruca vesicaria subsp. sativa]|uniref:Cation/H+ exchanger transmembrane domain-containing protein n=1 Tax=Eruca vesicaria subsp. sativa TaxID=29727 RepID=A0ABC8M654_ERUVS|nr:unnamed protein product [Eruca vesicaria subsp. sativa]
MSRLDLNEGNSMQSGKVHGPFFFEKLVCQTNHMLTSKGVFFGSDPLKYSMPLLLLQMAAIIITSRLLFRLLKPLKQGMISSQVLLPDGPPLGTGLTTKLEMYASSLMLPCFIAISGLQTNFFVIEQNHVKIIEAVILMITYICKFVGTAAASAYCNIEIGDSLSLAFLMCCQGVIEIYTSVMWRDEKVLIAMQI